MKKTQESQALTQGRIWLDFLRKHRAGIMAGYLPSGEPSSSSGQDLVGFPQGAQSWNLGWVSPTPITPPHHLYLPGHTQKTYINKVGLCPAKPRPTDCLSPLKCGKAALGCGSCGPNPLYQVSKAFQDIHVWVCAAQTPSWLCMEM